MAPLPPNPISGLLGGSNTPVSPPKPSSAPPGPQTVDSSPMGSLPLTLAPKGKLALPPNPITSSLLTGPKPSLQDQRNQQSKGLVADIAARRAQLQAHPVHGSIAGTIKEFTGANIHGFGHPLAALEGKGEFAPQKETFAGHKDVPMYGQPLPFFGGSSVLKDAGEAIVRRTPEEAAQHVFDSAQEAKAQGFGPVEGGGKGSPPLVKKGEATPATGGELGVQVREALSGKPKSVAPYVASGHEHVDGFLDHASRPGGIHQPGYVYHRTSVQAFSGIAKEGLKASSKSGDLHGVYFGANPLAVSHFANKAADSIFLRVRESVVPDLGLHPNKAYGEMVTPHDVPASDLEYLGKDGVWHPVSEHLGTYEKVGAKLDNPTFGMNAAQARKAQEGLYHDERAARAAAASDALARGDYEAALYELKGALPKVDFQGFKQFDETTVRAMEQHVMDHPVLRTYEKINTINSLRAALQGKVPTASEQKLLERAFGKEISGQISDSAGEIRKWPKMLVNLANVPRSLMASMDLSAPFRQGLVAGVSHPVIFAKNFAPMLKAARSESYFQNMIQDEIHARSTYPLMEKAKIAFTDIGKDAAHGAAATSQREEQFMSNYAEQIPGLGRVVRGSDRAYVGFLNKIRADVFDHLVQEASMQGHDVADEKFLQSIGKFVNSATGRGSIGPLTGHTATLNALFFSPRLLASRINFLNPVYYMKLDPFARKEALKALLSLGATATSVLEIAKMGGAKVNTDPTNADFGKIRVGNTRVDILGGFQQPIRLAAQLATNRVTSSTTGKVIPLGSGFGKTSRYDVIMKFLQGKLSPIPSLVVDATKGQDFTGKKLKWNDLSTYERVAASRMVPFLAQDIYDLETTSGPKAAGLLAPLDLFGVGVQAYKAKTPASSGGSAPSDSYGDSGGSYGDSGSGGYGDTGSSYGG